MGDGRPNAGEDEQSPIQETSLAAAKTVRVNILEWAGSNGFDFKAGAVVLGRTSHSMDGHVNVMKWAETNNLGIFPNSHSKAHHAAKGGQVAVLGWLKDRSMLTTNNGNHARSLPCYQWSFTSAGLALFDGAMTFTTTQSVECRRRNRQSLP